MRFWGVVALHLWDITIRPTEEWRVGRSEESPVPHHLAAVDPSFQSPCISRCRLPPPLIEYDVQVNQVSTALTSRFCSQHVKLSFFALLCMRTWEIGSQAAGSRVLRFYGCRNCSRITDWWGDSFSIFDLHGSKLGNYRWLFERRVTFSRLIDAMIDETPQCTLAAL